MKKTYVVSCYFKHNYGSMLQAYATQYFLDSHHIENETINISQLKDFSKGKKKYYLSQLFNFRLFRAKRGMIKLRIKRKFNRKLKANFKKRDLEFDRFKKRYFKLTKPFIRYDELTDLSNKDALNVVVGSDQLWLPVNVVANYYTASFTPNEVNKVSYATSLGISKLPKRYKKRYSSFLNRFDHLSVREETGKEIVESLVDKQCDVVCDPTLLLTSNDWNQIISDVRFEKEKYILCYFLGKAKEHRKFAEQLRKITGYKIVSINHCDEFVRYSDKFADETPYNVGPSEWLNLIKNAEYVCTDSFHGTVFSLLFNKTFFTFKRFTKKSSFSTNSRLSNLLSLVKLENRIYSGFETEEEIRSILNNNIDYSSIANDLNKFINYSKEYLLSSLKVEPKSNKGMYISHKALCDGCTACKNTCPKDAITMVKDEEGFLYPNVDQNKCIDCHICEQVCPSLKLVREDKKEQKAFLIRNLDEKVLKESTSGGAFSAIATYVLKNDGIVFGACFDENFIVKHISIDKVENLYRFRNSKYVQSDLGNTFQEVRKYLADGKLVLFSGTPCQIEGLKSYLQIKNINMDNLYLADIVCHSVPSPLVWEKYKELKRNEAYQPDAFRNKEKYGYEYSQMSFKDKDGKKKYYGSESDPFFRAFLSDLSIRPSCESCRFKKRYRESDLTLWDCFTIHKFDKSLDDNKGVTRCLTHSSKGEYLINQIKDSCIIKEIDPDKAVLYSRELVISVHGNPKREQFFEDAAIMNGDELFKKWFPNNLKIRIKRFTRKTLEKIGIYRPVKRFVKKILRKQ